MLFRNLSVQMSTKLIETKSLKSVFCQKFKYFHPHQTSAICNGKWVRCGPVASWTASCLLSASWVYCWVYKTWHFGSFLSSTSTCTTPSWKACLRNNRSWKKKGSNVTWLIGQSVTNIQCEKHKHIFLIQTTVTVILAYPVLTTLLTALFKILNL